MTQHEVSRPRATHQNHRASLVVFVTGGGSNLQALIDATAAPDYPARISLVVSNRANAYACERARQAGINCAVIDERDYPAQAAFEEAIVDRLAAHNINRPYIALAGFMRVLSAGFVDQFPQRIVNIHPSLLPRYKGLHTHQRVIDANEDEHGATVHFVVARLDAGPTIIQRKLRVQPDESASDLAQRVLAIEHVIFPQAVAWLTAGRLSVKEDRVYLDNKALDDE